MTDLDQRIASVLRERAEGETDTHRLLRTARAQGRRRQLRRRAAAGAALALAGVLGFVGVTGTDLDGLPGRLPWTAATPAVAAPVPPRADGVPGAAADPTRVGTDPQVLHFAVDPARARYLRWAVYEEGVESIRFTLDGGPPVLVEVGSSAELLSQRGVEGFPIDALEHPLSFDGSVRQVSGYPGGLIMGWRAAGGLYARVSMAGVNQAALRRAVDALRWDEARRCAAPLRLTTLPAGARIGGCSVDVSSYPGLITAEFTLKRTRTQYMWVRFRWASQVVATRTEGNRTVDGRPAYLSPKGTTLELLGIPKVDLVADFGWPWEGESRPTGFTEADATILLAGARVAKDPTRPDTWD